MGRRQSLVLSVYLLLVQSTHTDADAVCSGIICGFGETAEGLEDALVSGEEGEACERQGVGILSCYRMHILDGCSYSYAYVCVRACR